MSLGLGFGILVLGLGSWDIGFGFGSPTFKQNRPKEIYQCGIFLAGGKRLCECKQIDVTLMMI